ncbi:MAG: hypothetical protein ACJ72W_19845 [Actinoallomurus sp.]
MSSQPRDAGDDDDRQTNAAARLSEQAAEHVGRHYDATQEAFVGEQRKKGEPEDDEDVSPR